MISFRRLLHNLESCEGHLAQRSDVRCWRLCAHRGSGTPSLNSQTEGGWIQCASSCPQADPTLVQMLLLDGRRGGAVHQSVTDMLTKKRLRVSTPWSALQQVSSMPARTKVGTLVFRLWKASCADLAHDNSFDYVELEFAWDLRLVAGADNLIALQVVSFYDGSRISCLGRGVRRTCVKSWSPPKNLWE